MRAARQQKPKQTAHLATAEQNSKTPAICSQPLFLCRESAQHITLTENKQAQTHRTTGNQMPKGHSPEPSWKGKDR